MQTVYDLHARVAALAGSGSAELCFRLSEVDSWLAQMEHADAERHPFRDADGRLRKVTATRVRTIRSHGRVFTPSKRHPGTGEPVSLDFVRQGTVDSLDG